MTVHSGFEIPRFVALLGHFALLLILLWDVEAVARSSVSWSKRDDHHLLELAQNSITGALAMALTLVTVELTCFMIGASLFFPRQSLFSAAIHTFSFLCLGHFMADSFHLTYYWVLLVITAVPCLIEIAILFEALVLDKPL